MTLFASHEKEYIRFKQFKQFYINSSIRIGDNGAHEDFHWTHPDSARENIENRTFLVEPEVVSSGDNRWRLAWE